MPTAFGTGKRVKSDRFVDIPLVMRFVPKSEHFLKGIVVHEGKTVDQGHFRAFACCSDRWCDKLCRSARGRFHISGSTFSDLL